MNLNQEELQQALQGRRDVVIWRGLRCTCVDVTGDVATIIWKPGERFERVPASEVRPAVPGDEYVDHCDRIIVVKPAPELDSVWTSEGLRRGPWTAYVEGARETEHGFLIDPPDPDLWRGYVGGYMVSDQDVVVRNDGMSRTYVVYLKPREYVQRLAQRALELWCAEAELKVEREKDARIAGLVEQNTLLREEVERLWQRLGKALAREMP
jgi:hypothetical protein